MHKLVPLCVVTILLSGRVALCAGVRQAKSRPSQWPVVYTSGCTENQAETADGGSLYGKGYAYILSAPNGWVFDDEAGKAQGLNVVFYRRGESWSDGEVVMYSNVAYKEKGKDNTLKKVIKYDISRMKERKAKLKSATPSRLKLDDGTKAIIYTFTFSGADDAAAHEKVAYIDTPKVVVMLVLTARTEAAYTKAIPDFRRLVHSFQFIADRVQINRTKGTHGNGVAKGS
jgi:hypothetical protein